MFRPYLLAIFRELSLVYVAYVSTYMSEIPHAIKIMVIKYIYIFLLWRCDPTRVMASSFTTFLDHTQRRIHSR
jgi:hypothetical protein